MRYELTLPEPLLTAALGAARLMAIGASGTSGRSGAFYDYAGLATKHRAAMIDLMRQVIEHEAAPQTLRESSAGLPNGDVHESFGFVARLVVCRVDGRGAQVGAVPYLLSAPRCQAGGLTVKRVSRGI